MGIRFWRTAVGCGHPQNPGPPSLHHYEASRGLRALTIQIKPWDLNKAFNLILSLRVSFWMETVRDQNSKEVKDKQ